jgi:integrase
MANVLSQKLSDKLISGSKRPDKPVVLRDGDGLVLRLSAAKTGPWRNWYFIYTSPENGKKVYKPLGCYPDISLAAARKEATTLRAILLKKIDPVEADRRIVEARLREEEEQRRLQEIEDKAMTVADLVSEYIERHAKVFKRSWQDDERLLNKEVVAVWGRHKAADIKKRDISPLLQSIVDRGSPAMSNQVFKVVRKMFNFAVEKDILQSTPCLGVKALSPNTSRERTLTEDEIKTLWGTIDTASISDEVRRALKLVLLTAQRPGEVAGIHTSEIDGSWWTIPSARSKNGKAHRVYLTATALSLLGNTTGKGFVFRCPHESREQSIDSHSLPVAVRRNLVWPLTDSKGKPLYQKDRKPATENKLGIDKFTPHDLRRTAATFMSGLGFHDEVIDAVLNHGKKGIIGTYNRYKYDREKQQALESWERKLLSIISGTESNVIPISRKKAA